jgi:hypothetical protein
LRLRRCLLRRRVLLSPPFLRVATNSCGSERYMYRSMIARRISKKFKRWQALEGTRAQRQGCSASRRPSAN